MISPPDLSRLTEAEKDALIPALWAQVQALTARVAELEARLHQPRKTAACACASATSRCATACSPFSSTPTRRRTTTAASVIFGRWWCTARSLAASAPPGGRACAPPSSRSSAPPPGTGWTPTTPSMPSCRAGPSSPPVEQLPPRCSRPARGDEVSGRKGTPFFTLQNDVYPPKPSRGCDDVECDLER